MTAETTVDLRKVELDGLIDTQQSKLQSVLAAIIARLNDQSDNLEQLHGNMDTLKGTMQSQAKTLEDMRSENSAAVARLGEHDALMQQLGIDGSACRSQLDNHNGNIDSLRRDNQSVATQLENHGTAIEQLQSNDAVVEERWNKQALMEQKQDKQIEQLRVDVDTSSAKMDAQLQLHSSPRQETHDGPSFGMSEGEMRSLQDRLNQMEDRLRKQEALNKNTDLSARLDAAAASQQSSSKQQQPRPDADLERLKADVNRLAQQLARLQQQANGGQFFAGPSATSCGFDDGIAAVDAASFAFGSSVIGAGDTAGGSARIAPDAGSLDGTGGIGGIAGSAASGPGTDGAGGSSAGGAASQQGIDGAVGTVGNSGGGRAGSAASQYRNSGGGGGGIGNGMQSSELDDIRRRIGELASQVGSVVHQQRLQEQGKMAASGAAAGMQGSDNFEQNSSTSGQDYEQQGYQQGQRGQLHRTVSQLADQLSTDAQTSDVGNLRHEVSQLTQQLAHLMEQQGHALARRPSNAGALGGATSEELAQLKAELARISEQLGPLADSVDGSATRLAGHDASLESIMAQLQALQSRCESAEGEAKTALTPEALEEFMASQQHNFQSNQEESLQGIRSEFGKELNSRLKAFSDRELAQASRHKNEVAQLRAELELFVGLDSAITARCLSCFDRRMQLKTESVTGSDGRVYTQSRPSPVPTAETKLPRVKLRGAHIAARPDVPGVPGSNRFSFMADVQVEGTHLGEMGRSASTGSLERGRFSPISDGTIHSR